METISNTGATLDQLEESLAQLPSAGPTVVSRFTPGLYIREVTIPAGYMGTSMVHRKEHPFVISKGRVKVTSENEGSVIYEAPFTGITKTGTRRGLLAETETVWTTFHVTDETDIEKIAAEILEPHTNALLSENHPALNQWRDQPSTIQ